MKRRRKEAEPWRDNLDRCEEHWTTGLWEGTMCQKQGCGPVQGVWSPSPSPLSSSAPPEKLTSPEASLLCRSCIMSFRHMMSLNSHFTDEEIESPRVKVYKAYKWQRTDSVSRTPEPMFPPLPCTALLS